MNVIVIRYVNHKPMDVHTVKKSDFEQYFKAAPANVFELTETVQIDNDGNGYRYIPLTGPTS